MLSFTVPASKLEKDPELRELLNDSGVSFFLSSVKLVVKYIDYFFFLPSESASTW